MAKNRRVLVGRGRLLVGQFWDTGHAKGRYGVHTAVWFIPTETHTCVRQVAGKRGVFRFAMRRSGVRSSSAPPLFQRPTVLGWAFSFAGSAHHAGFRAVLRVPTVAGTGGMTRPVRPCSALSSLKTCANFFAVAHADGVVRQPLVRVPMGMVGSRICTSKLE